MLLGAVVALVATADAVPISSVSEQTLAAEIPSRILGGPLAPDSQAFLSRSRSSPNRRAPITEGIPASPSTSISIASTDLLGGPDPGAAYAEFTSVQFVSSTAGFRTAQPGQMSLQDKPENFSLKNPREPSMIFEDEIPFLELLRDAGVSRAWISLGQNSRSPGNFEGTAETDLLASSMGNSGMSSQLDSSGNAPISLETLRSSVPNVRDQEGITANIVYMLSLMADPYRILVNHPVLVFVGFCFLAFFLSLRRR
jgi:hypothetical protein